jgi:2-amino-4-hydroxy-6-hydroxymethyldihydropteridine diphosphokinase
MKLAEKTMKKNLHRVGLLLGSNIQPEINIPLALAYLQKSLTRITISSIWESRAVGSDGANFLNAAMLASTGLDAELLKTQVLRPIETQLGRVRTSDKNAPRTIDLDILIFDQEILEPGLWLYAFRAVPLAEIMPDIYSEAGEAL